MGLFGNKLASLGSGLENSPNDAKNAVGAAAGNMKIPTALTDLTDKAAAHASDAYTSGKGHGHP